MPDYHKRQGWQPQRILAHEPQKISVLSGLARNEHASLDFVEWVQKNLGLQEKAKCQGWSPEKLNCAGLTLRQVGMALGNAWPLNVSARLVFQMNRAMGWCPSARDPFTAKATKNRVISAELTFLAICHLAGSPT